MTKSNRGNHLEIHDNVRTLGGKETGGENGDGNLHFRGRDVEGEWVLQVDEWTGAKERSTGEERCTQ